MYYCCSAPRLCPTLCDPMNCSMPSFLVLHHLLELAQTYAHWVSDTIQPFHPLSCPSPPAFNLSQHQSLFNGSGCRIRWPKHWSFSFSISPSIEYSGLISFRLTDLVSLKPKGLPHILLQHHSSKALTLPHSAFFMVELPHPYMTAGKTTALTWWTFVAK